MTPEKKAAISMAVDHNRQWRKCLYVYPVISRRANGLSIGINLSPDKRCNFSCLYCQVDRRLRREVQQVDLDLLDRELRLALEAAVTGDLWQEPFFAATPPALRRINDIAFSGDGEPTSLPNFDQAVALTAKAKSDYRADDVKIVVITNATCLDQPQFQRALPMLDSSRGEIWAKLDAGTEEFFATVDRPHPRITLEKIVGNITAVGKERQLVIQTLFFKINGQPPAVAEIEAYIGRLREILSGGGQIKLVQVHTIARAPATMVYRLGDQELDAIADKIRAAVPGLPVNVYYGADIEPQNGKSVKSS